MYNFCHVGIPQAYKFVRLLRDGHFVFEYFNWYVIQFLPFGQCPQIYVCILKSVGVVRRWNSYSFSQWNGKGKPVWRPFCVQSLKNIDLINILCAIPTSFHSTFISNDSFAKQPTETWWAWCPVHVAGAHLYYLQNTHPALKRVWESMSLQLWAICTRLFSIYFSIYLDARETTAFCSLTYALFQLTQFINTIQIINSIYHRFTFCNRAKKEEAVAGQHTTKVDGMRIVFVALPTTIVTASLLPDHPSL